MESRRVTPLTGRRRSSVGRDAASAPNTCSVVRLGEGAYFGSTCERGGLLLGVQDAVRSAEAVRTSPETSLGVVSFAIPLQVGTQALYGAILVSSLEPTIHHGKVAPAEGDVLRHPVCTLVTHATLSFPVVSARVVDRTVLPPQELIPTLLASEEACQAGLTADKAVSHFEGQIAEVSVVLLTVRGLAVDTARAGVAQPVSLTVLVLQLVEALVSTLVAAHVGIRMQELGERPGLAGLLLAVGVARLARMHVTPRHRSKPSVHLAAGLRDEPEQIRICPHGCTDAVHRAVQPIVDLEELLVIDRVVVGATDGTGGIDEMSHSDLCIPRGFASALCCATQI